jgi:hypothetical protein
MPLCCVERLPLIEQFAGVSAGTIVLRSSVCCSRKLKDLSLRAIRHERSLLVRVLTECRHCQEETQHLNYVP